MKKLLMAFVILLALNIPALAINIDIGGGGSISPGGALSADNKHPNEYSAIKVSKISGDGRVLHKQWIIRYNSNQTPSSYYYFQNSHKIWHKLNPGSNKVPSVQQGTSGFTVITDTNSPRAYTLVSGSITANSNFASSAKTYFKDLIKGNTLERSSTIEDFTAEGGFYIFEPMMSIVFGGTNFMLTPAEMAKLDIADGGTSSQYGDKVRNFLVSYTQRQAPELAFAENDYKSISINGGKPSFDVGSGNSGRWRSPTILSSALGFGVVSGTGEPTRHTISFNANGGSGTMSSVTVDHGKNYTIKRNGFTRSGYTFTGWRTGKSSGTSYKDRGTISNVKGNITLYAQWSASRTISFNANGGTGTMSSVTVNNGSNYTIKSNAFTRIGYRFTGWRTGSSSGTSYAAGATISNVTSNITLYAQWQIITYTVNFNLQGGTRTGGGVLSQTVNHGSNATAPTVWRDEHTFLGWDKGFTNVTSNLTVNARWQELPVENLTINFVNPNADYTEGTEVISTYRIYNGGGVNARPRHNVSVSLAVTYDGGSVTVPTKNQVVIPRANENIVFFKWHVPDGTAGKTFTLASQIRVNGGAVQDTSTVSRLIESVKQSQTPVTEYERDKPHGWSKTDPVSAVTPKTASWNFWEYVLSGDSYVMRNFGTSIENTKVESEPDSNYPSREKQGGVWVMRSGYGLTAKITQTFSAFSGMLTPAADAFTHAQNGYALFPEFNYQMADNKYRHLQSTGTGVFEVRQNPEAKNSGRLHFTPLWFPDGDYTVQGFVTDLWTPAGMLSGYFNAPAVKIADSAYDDWVVGRRG